jgi:hypothetical protein
MPFTDIFAFPSAKPVKGAETKAVEFSALLEAVQEADGKMVYFSLVF